VLIVAETRCLRHLDSFTFHLQMAFPAQLPSDFKEGQMERVPPPPLRLERRRFNRFVIAIIYIYIVAIYYF
jgi:hypothetical protein